MIHCEGRYFSFGPLLCFVCLINVCFSCTQNIFSILRVTSMLLGCVLCGSFTHSTPQEFMVSGPTAQTTDGGIHSAKPSFLSSSGLTSRGVATAWAQGPGAELQKEVCQGNSTVKDGHWHSNQSNINCIFYVTSLWCAYIWLRFYLSCFFHSVKKQSNKNKTKLDAHGGWNDCFELTISTNSTKFNHLS